MQSPLAGADPRSSCLRSIASRAPSGGRTLFEDLTSTLRPGERYAFVGASGSGKTSLLRVMAGRDEPDGGRRRRGLRMACLPQEVEAEPPADAPISEAVLTAADEIRAIGREAEELAVRMAALSQAEADPEGLARVTENGQAWRLTFAGNPLALFIVDRAVNVQSWGPGRGVTGIPAASARTERAPRESVSSMTSVTRNPRPLRRSSTLVGAKGAITWLLDTPLTAEEDAAMKRLLMVGVLLSLMSIPALAQEEGVQTPRWDPTGTYIVIDEEGSCVSPGTTFLVQFVPADMAKRHFFIMQNRVSNIVSGSFDISGYETVRGEMWRTGRNSFKWTSILYTYGASGEPSYSFVNTGNLVRRPNGETWSEDLYFYYYFGDQNPLDPDIEPWLTFGPCSMRFVSKLEYVPPPAD